MKIIKQLFLLWFAFICILNQSFAQTNINVSNKATASLGASCSATANSVSFNFTPAPTGTYDSAVTAYMTCTKGTVVNVQINDFTFVCGERVLALNGGNPNTGTPYMQFNIYTDSSYSKIYTNTGYGCESYGLMPNFTGTGTQQPLPLYIRIPANQYPQPGIYTTGVTVMLKY